MHLARIRRYPVKAMGGEDLVVVMLDERGLVGDRWFAVRDADGRLAACKDTRRFRRRDGVTRFAAWTEGDGTTWVTDGARHRRVGDPALDVQLGQALDAPVTVAPEGDVPHQDAGQVSLVGTATIDWCTRAWDVDLDVRRLRANLVIATDEPFVEESWLGRTVAIGRSVTLHVVERVPRCRTVDVAQDGTQPHQRLLPRLTRERDGQLAVYANVVHTGSIALGDRVEASGGLPV